MTDEMALLLEAFGLEAGDYVERLAQDLNRLERTPGDGPRWSTASATFRLLADSAVMMDLPDVQWLAGQGRDACQAMADHGEWQRAEVVEPLRQALAALGRLLDGLGKPGADLAEPLAQGKAAFAVWR